jgi:hypothetical protein
METAGTLNLTASSRDLVRRLRSGLENEDQLLPESIAWQVFLELRRRGEPEANRLFIGALRNLHSRRTMGVMPLPVDDQQIDEHRLVDDPFLADLWKAYKKCIRTHRTGPASQLLRDIEEQIGK